MRTKLLKYLAPVVLALAVAACVSAEEAVEPNGQTDAASATVALHVDAGDFLAAGTRATAKETEIKTMIAFVFEGTGPDAVLTQARRVNRTAGTVELDVARGVHTVVLAANEYENVNTYPSGLPDGFNETNLPRFETKYKGNITLSQFERMHPLNIVINRDRNIFMSGIVTVDGINKNTTIGTAEKPVALIRSVAKVTVEATDGFEIAYVYLLSAGGTPWMRFHSDIAKFGDTYAGDGSPLEISRDVISPYHDSGGWLLADVPTSAGDAVFSGGRLHDTSDYPAYSGEIKNSPDEYWPGVIVKGKMAGQAAEAGDRFYRLYFKNEGEAPMDVIRNKHYHFTITVDGPGYADIRSAIDMPPSNVGWVIGVNELGSHDVVTNGQYYLGVTNSETVVCDDVATMAGALLTTVSSDVRYSQHVGASGGAIWNGLRAEVIAGADKGLTVSIGAGTDHASEKYSSKDISFGYGRNFTEGVVRITMGDLLRDIRVVHRTDLLDPSGVPALIDDQVCHAELGTGGDWLTGLSSSPDEVGGGEKRLTSTTPQPLYVCKQSNTHKTGGQKRDGGVVFYSRKADDTHGVGRVKVMVAQEALSLSRTWEVPSSDDNMYVGAFWRADQRGERIIRMKNMPEGRWTAWVAWADERWNDGDIVFGTERSADGGVTFAANENPRDAEEYQVAGNAPWASGTVGGDGEIYFRIGLRSHWLGMAPARYAVVVLRYADGAKMHRIFLRQGHDADYVMSGGDARMLSPYNLTVAQGRKADLKQTGSVGLAPRGGAFTDFPSQSGAFFTHVSGMRNIAWSPERESFSGWTMTDTESAWNTATDETCPDGYRRAKDTEFINSMGVKNNLGLYADGFFDRRDNGQVAFGGTGVAVRSVDIAATGVVYFNPDTYASVFLPFAGRINGSGWRDDLGEIMYYRYSTNGAYSNSGGSERVELQGFSVRCVKAATPPLQRMGNLAPPGVLGVGAESGRLTIRGSKEYANVRIDGQTVDFDLVANSGVGLPLAEETVYTVVFRFGSLIAISMPAGGGDYVFSKDDVVWVPEGYDYEALLDRIGEGGGAKWADTGVIKAPIVAAGASPQEDIPNGIGDPCKFADGGGANWRTPAYPSAEMQDGLRLTRYAYVGISGDGLFLGYAGVAITPNGSMFLPNLWRRDRGGATYLNMETIYLTSSHGGGNIRYAYRYADDTYGGVIINMWPVSETEGYPIRCVRE